MKEAFALTQKSLPGAFLVVLCLFVAAANITWLASDNSPQAWDESIHLNAAAGFAKILKSDPVAVPGALITKETFYPPLVPFIGSFFALLSLSPDVITFSNTIFLCLLIVSVFLLARDLYGNLPAMAAASAVVSFPLIYSQSHLFMFDLPLTACVAFFAWLMGKTGKFTRLKYAVACGAFAGLAMLVKWTFFIFAAAPLIVAMTGTTKENRKNLLWFCIAALIVCGPWYIWNLIPLAKDLFFYTAKQGAVEGLPPVLSLASLFYYLKMLPNVMTLPLLVLVLAAFVLMLVKKETRFLIIYILIPLLVFTFMSNKKDRYLMPLLPFAAVAVSYLIHATRSKAKMGLFIALALLPLIHLFSAVYAVPYKWPYSNRPQTGDWKIKEILSQLPSGEKITLSVVPDNYYMNNVSYSYYADNYYPTVKAAGIYNFPAFYDYALVKSGDIGSGFMGLSARGEITRNLVENKSYGRLFEPVYEAALPDGSIAKLFKRKSDIMQDSAALRRNSMSMISKYLRSARGFTLNFSGNTGSLQVSFKEGYVGDFSHKEAGMTVKNLDIRVNGLVADPEALEKGELKILDLDNIEIVSVEVGAKELEAFALQYAKGVSGLVIDFTGGLIVAKAEYNKIPVEASVRLYNPSAEDPDIAVEIKKLRVKGVPVPAGLLNFLIKDYNPLVKKTNSPFRLKFNGIKIDGGKLLIY